MVALGGAPAPFVAGAVVVLGVAILVESRRGSSSRRATLSPAVGLLAAGVLWQLAQIVPVPAGVVSLLSPRAAELARLGHEAAGVAWSWSTLSLAPGETAVAVARTSIPLLALWLLRLRTSSSSESLAKRALVLAAAALVVVVLVHTAAGANAIYGAVEVRGRGFSPVVSPFVNANDLAVFCAALVPALALASASLPTVPRLGVVGLAAAVGLLCLLSLSRSATLGIGVGLLVVLGGLLVSGRRHGAAVVAASAALVGAGLLATVVAIEPRARLLLDRVGLMAMNGRIEVWGVARRIVADFPLFGVGGRGFGAVWSSYEDGHYEVYAQDAEGLLPQLAATLGLPVALVLAGLGAAVLLLAVRRAVASAKDGQLAPLGAAAGLCALAAMAMVTMTTTQPAVTVLAVYLLRIAGGQPHRHVGGARAASVVAAAVAAVAVGALAWGHPRTMRATDAWFQPRLAADVLEDGDDPRAVALRHPADPYGYAWTAVLLRRTAPGEALRLVNRAMELGPFRAEPHRAAASVLLTHGLREQAIGEVQRALTAATRKELPRFVEDALRLYPDEDQRLRLLPRDPDAAVRVARVIAARGEAPLTVAVWRHLAGRARPPFEAVEAASRLVPPAEALALAAAARGTDAGDHRFAALQGELLIRSGDLDGGRRVLEAHLRDAVATDDLWRGKAIQLLGEAALDGHGAAEAVLAIPSRGGTTEEAMRAWLRAELRFSEGRGSEALREMTRALELRPDLGFLQTRSDALRERLR